MHSGILNIINPTPPEAADKAGAVGDITANEAKTVTSHKTPNQWEQGGQKYHFRFTIEKAPSASTSKGGARMIVSLPGSCCHDGC